MSAILSWNRFAWLGLALLCALGSVGCCQGEMRTFDVTVSLHESMKDTNGVYPAVEVDLVGMNSGEVDRWTNMSVSKYFQPNEKARAYASRIPVALSDEKRSETVALSKPENAKIWEEWKKNNVIKIVVLSSKPLPTEAPNPNDPSKADLRRLVVPITCNYWDGGVKSLHITVAEYGLTVNPPPTAPK